MERKYLKVSPRCFSKSRANTFSEKEYDIYFNKSVVAVGWNEVDFTKFEKSDTDNLLKAVKQNCYISKGLDEDTCFKLFLFKGYFIQVGRFHSINCGDRIIVPFYDTIRLAVAEETTYYDQSIVDYELSNIDNESVIDFQMANQRKVSYLYTGDSFKTIPIETLSASLQHKLILKSTTVLDLEECKEEIERLFEED